MLTFLEISRVTQSLYQPCIFIDVLRLKSYDKQDIKPVLFVDMEVKQLAGNEKLYIASCKNLLQ